MKLALRRIKVYGKLGLIWAIAILVLLIVLFNRDKVVDVWFFGPHPNVNVLYLMLLTAVTSIAVFWAVTRIRGVLREARALREERQTAEQLAQREKLEGDLAEREKRLDEKLRRSITEES